jgi:hypothetical protein
MKVSAIVAHNKRSAEKLVLMISALAAAFIACFIIMAQAAKVSLNILSSEALQLFFYFAPMWYAGGYYSLSKIGLNRTLNALSLAVIGSFFVFIIKYFRILGLYNSLIWAALFPVLFLLMLSKKFKLHYSVFISMMLTVLMTEVWEIPIHAITLMKTPTFEQLGVKFMLSSVYLILLVPLLFEMRKFHLHQKFLAVVCLGNIVMFPPLLWSPMLQNSGYPLDEVNYVYRLIWCAVSVAFIWRLKK